MHSRDVPVGHRDLLEDVPGVEQAEEEEEEICGASEEWLPNTPAARGFRPLPHPAGECPFYRASWQQFLVATQPDADGNPDFLNWATVGSLFQSVRDNSQRSYLGDVRQAGGRQILIDQNERAVYYGIHVNAAFVDFVEDNGLTTRQAVQAAPPGLFFPAGVVELKSAWMEITGEPAADYEDYVKTTTTVPTLSKADDGSIVEDRDRPRTVEVALLALHVAHTMPGHPEFIWGSFEHTTGGKDLSAADGKRDVAPTYEGSNPSPDDPDNLGVSAPAASQDYKVYRAGVPVNRANQAIADAALELDETSQTFPGQTTSIYRMFPASKSHSTEPDAALSSLNFNVGQLFAAKADIVDPVDKRGFYRQVGSVWMDKPGYFRLDQSLQNDSTSPLVQAGGDLARADLAENGGDSDYSLLAGEDRMSSTVMESFTQGPTSFPNCFSCHNTQAVTARGIPANKDAESEVLMQPKLLNVSHVFSQFVLEELAAEDAATQ
jgi:hypothetical protein